MNLPDKIELTCPECNTTHKIIGRLQKLPILCEDISGKGCFEPLPVEIVNRIKPKKELKVYNN